MNRIERMRALAGSVAPHPGLPWGWARCLLLILALSLAVLGTNLAALWLVAGQPYHVDAGAYGDQLLLKGFFDQESNDEGLTTYRWTGLDSHVLLEGAALSPQARLQLTIGGTPTGATQPLPVALTVNGRSWGSIGVATTPRHYLLLLPSQDASLDLGLSSPLTRAPGEQRSLGLRLDGVTLWLGPGPLLPPAGQLLAQLACLLLFGAMLGALGTPPVRLVAVLALATVALAVVQALALPLMALYLPRLVLAAALLALLTYLGLPLARRWLPWLGAADLRWLWAAALLAAGLRLAAMLYPPFATHDLALNLKRFDSVARGILILVAPSTEFADQMTIYPPGPYIVLLPSYLLTSFLSDGRPLALQLGVALLDGSSAFFVGLLALRLGTGSVAARMAALLYAGSALSFTALWWGFTAQAFGQWLTVPLALLLISSAEQPRPRTWLAAFVVFELALLAHAGVAVLDVVWVTLTLLLLALNGQMRPAWWRGAAAFYIASGLVAFALLYVDVFFFLLGETRQVGQTVGAGLGRGIGPLFLKGTLLAYTPPGLLIVGAGLWRLRRRVPRPAAWAVAAAWLSTVLLFIAVDLLFGLIVRHLYFMLPLACVAAALLLSELAARARWAQLLAWSLVALYAASGLMLWWLATVEYIKPSMAPLTH